MHLLAGHSGTKHCEIFIVGIIPDNLDGSTLTVVDVVIEDRSIDGSRVNAEIAAKRTCGGSIPVPYTDVVDHCRVV